MITRLFALCLVVAACGGPSRPAPSGGGGGVQPGDGGAGEGAGGTDGGATGGEAGDGGGALGGTEGEGDGEGEGEVGEGEGGDVGEGEGEVGGAGGEGGGAEGGPFVVPEFGADAVRRLDVIANARHGLRNPRDLEFNPERPEELWVIDETLEGAVIFFDALLPDRRWEPRVDVAGAHFMAHVSSLAFGADSTFGTCHESRNEVDPTAPDFMGPTLWSSDLNVYARIGQRGEDGRNGSHLDMLHQSPMCMGIAHEEVNVYWVADGAGGPHGSGGLPHIVRYDFGVDHGPGRSDHSDGRVRRYVEAEFHPVEGVPSHLARDPNSDWLYFLETGRGKVMRLDTTTGRVTRQLNLNHELLAEYSEVTGVTVEEWATEGLEQPTGIAVGPERIFVSDFATAEIIAYDHEGQELGRMDTRANEIMGITLGPEGRLWFVDAGFAEVVRVLPEGD